MLPLLCFRLNVSLKGFTLRKKKMQWVHQEGTGRSSPPWEQSTGLEPWGSGELLPAPAFVRPPHHPLHSTSRRHN